MIIIIRKEIRHHSHVEAHSSVPTQGFLPRIHKLLI